MTRYAFLDKNIKARNMADFVHGHGWNLLQLEENSFILQDAEMIAVHGVLRGNSNLIRQAMMTKTPWVYMDNAGDYFPPECEMYKRVCLNSTAPTIFRSGKRFEHNVKIMSWRGGRGDKILLLPPSPPYMDTFDLRNWLNEMAHTINIYTGREIVVRAKPAKGRFARPLQEQLNEAYCVVTWGSAIALEAMRMGIPTISTGWCPAKIASKKLEDLETSEMLVEPDRMSIFNSLTWSCFSKKELDSAYNIVMENYNCNP